MLETDSAKPHRARSSEPGAIRRRTLDQLETDLVACAQLIGQLRTDQASLLAELWDQAIYQSDGSRSMKDCTAARLDVTHDTAGALLTATKAEELIEDVSFDRAVATARLVAHRRHQPGYRAGCQRGATATDLSQLR